jgi:hypothetical protein
LHIQINIEVQHGNFHPPQSLIETFQPWSQDEFSQRYYQGYVNVIMYIYIVDMFVGLYKFENQDPIYKWYLKPTSKISPLTSVQWVNSWSYIYIYTYIYTYTCMYIYIYIWANCNKSLTWNKGLLGWFHLLTMIPVRSQRGR